MFTHASLRCAAHHQQGRLDACCWTKLGCSELFSRIVTETCCLQEYKQRLVKAKKYIQNLKQQAADATAARDQAVTDLQAVQHQLKEKSTPAAGTDDAGDESISKAEYHQLQVSLWSDFYRHKLHTLCDMFITVIMTCSSHIHMVLAI